MRVLILSAVLGLSTIAQAGPVDVATYVGRPDFEEIKLSPNGDYYAASVPRGDRSVLVVVRRSDNKATAGFSLERNTYVNDFDWVNPTRIVISTSRKFGALDNPQLTGNLYAINADGSGRDVLVGQDVAVTGIGSRLQQKKMEAVAAFLVDPLAADDRNVLISVSGFDADSYSTLERMDVYTGARTKVLRGPVRNASFVVDAEGVVRFAHGYDLDNNRKLFYRPDGNSIEWKLVNEEATSGVDIMPLGFSVDGKSAYLRSEQLSGPDAIVAMDLASGKMTEVLRDDDSDPVEAIHALGLAHPPVVGAVIADGRPRAVFFDAASQDAQLQRGLEDAFPGQTVSLRSRTDDGRLVLLEVASDRNLGEFYLFDTVAKRAAFLVARREAQHPAKMAEVRPFHFTARDGLGLRGYLTLPSGREQGARVPLVIMPHGGPYGIADGWQFDGEAQLLAAAGYGVLQVNFRGSGGQGRAFMTKGARQWGLAMQDDLTDATRWAIQQGIADAGRICIYGASYGGYAALMGAAKEPDMYRCAVGYVGVYDLPLMFTKGDTRSIRSGRAYLRDWLGDPVGLADVSPVNLAARIKSPVFLAAGGEDDRAPIAHSERMESALRAAGVPVETLYYGTEGHGFYVEQHRVEYYSRLLAFLARHLGGEVATATAGGTSAAAR